MPLYDYACRKCGRRFEEFLLGDERPVCPRCGAKTVRRLMSGSFAVRGGGGGGADGGGGSGGGGSAGGSSCASCRAASCRSCGSNR